MTIVRVDRPMILTDTIEYTPRLDWGVEQEDPRFTKWGTDGDPVPDILVAMAKIKAATGHSPNVLILPGGKRLVDPTLEQGIMALTGCTEAEASAYADAFWRERLAGCGEIEEEP